MQLTINPTKDKLPDSITVLEAKLQPISLITVLKNVETTPSISRRLYCCLDMRPADGTRCGDGDA